MQLRFDCKLLLDDEPPCCVEFLPWQQPDIQRRPTVLLLCAFSSSRWAAHTCPSSLTMLFSTAISIREESVISHCCTTRFYQAHLAECSDYARSQPAFWVVYVYLIIPILSVRPVSECQTAGMPTDWIDNHVTLPSVWLGSALRPHTAIFDELDLVKNALGWVIGKRLGQVWTSDKAGAWRKKEWRLKE